MYRDNSVEKGYEDAIPVKRSRRSERARSETRKMAAAKKGSVDFSISRSASGSRSVPKSSVPTPKVSEQSKIPKPEQMREVPKPERQTNTVPTAVRSENPSAVNRPMPVPRPTPVAKPVKAAVATVTETETDINETTPLRKSPDFESIILPEIPEDTGVSHSGGISNMHTIVRDPSFNTTRQNAEIRRKLTAGKIIRRSLLSVFTALVLVITAVFGACYTVAVGPSETVRNILVLSALQASATKWVPGLFLDDAVVDQILEDSRKVNKDVISVEDYQNQQNEENAEDKWANAIDGMIYETVSGPTFKGYVLLVKDPSRVTVGVATDNFTNDTEGLRIFDMAEKYGSVAAINGGEYPDAGGMGIGGRPIGLTYSDGECVWNDGLRRSFMGFDKNNKLIVREGLTKAEADELGIRDGVCFQTGKTLITNEDGNVTMYYADNDTGTAQRTAIGQSADGTVIMLVTDGRTASSLGATHNDVIDVMVSYGAISAGMLDGGSSSLMYYKDYYDKYGIDTSTLDEYQKMGLINKYKAFTTPRRLPTCFIVAPE